MIAKLTKSEARTLRRLINKVVAATQAVTNEYYSQPEFGPMPEFKRCTRALKEFIDKRTEQ